MLSIRFDSIRTNRHESFPFFENIASRVYTGWVENVVDSIRFDSNESTRIVSLFWKYSVPGLYRVGWKCCRFDSIRTNRHESLPLLSIRYAGSRFARDLENIASRVYTGWVGNVVESTRIVSPAVDSLCRKSICASLWNYSVPGLYRVGWKCCRFDSIRFELIDTNRFPCCRFVILEVDLRDI